MKPLVYRFVLIFIILTVVATIGLQLHWNIRNYYENRRQLLNEIQTALDNGVESYFADKSKKDILVFADSLNAKFPGRFVDAENTMKDSIRTTELKIRHFPDSGGKSVRIYRSSGMPPQMRAAVMIQDKFPDKDKKEIMMFTTKIVSAIMSDSIDVKKLGKDISAELSRKNIKIDYSIFHTAEHLSRHPENPKLVNAMAKSTFLPPGENIRFSYPDPTALVLSRSMTEIILSLLLSLSIIGCMLYLLHIINRQKKIDEIRNDLISNITHEFKTPITTIGSAIEGIRSFNEANDREKTNRYLDISEKQLGKLQTMVEKLLDTATLDSGEIVLKKEPVDVVALLNTITERHLMGTDSTRGAAELGGANIVVKNDTVEPIFIRADAFHLENAISNLVDNAVKYGGDEIIIRLEQTKGQISIFVEDNGAGIDFWHRDQIFEKFYRIPTGNIHNVKGFGIGLYYSRKIVEKHEGRLELLTGNKTVFKLTLPDA